MSLYGLLTTSTSGMSAQSSLLNAISDNIANVGTTGYKQATTEFSSLVLESGLTSTYQSGGVIVDPQVQVDGQGALNATSSPSDLAVKGTGFFIVAGPNNQPVLTRVGSFTENAAGNLVNAAGYTLLGYPPGTSPSANGFGGLVPVNLSSVPLKATATTSGELYVNLPSNSAVVPTSATVLRPSQNSQYKTGDTFPYTDKTSLVTYDNLGNQVTLDVYYTNEGNNTWNVAIYNAADAATGGGFPYSHKDATGATVYDSPLNDPNNAGAGNTTMNFNPTTGALTGIFDPTTSATTGPTSVSLDIPGGTTMSLDLAQTTQLATDYTPLKASTNGSAPSPVTGFNIGTDGTVSVAYQNGATN